MAANAAPQVFPVSVLVLVDDVSAEKSPALLRDFSEFDLRGGAQLHDNLTISAAVANSVVNPVVFVALERVADQLRALAFLGRLCPSVYLVSIRTRWRRSDLAGLLEAGARDVLRPHDEMSMTRALIQASRDFEYQEASAPVTRARFDKWDLSSGWADGSCLSLVLSRCLTIERAVFPSGHRFAGGEAKSTIVGSKLSSLIPPFLCEMEAKRIAEVRSSGRASERRFNVGTPDHPRIFRSVITSYVGDDRVLVNVWDEGSVPSSAAGDVLELNAESTLATP